MVFAHGNESGILTTDFNGYDAADVAKWIRSQPNYSPGMSVQLNACHAADSGLAQNVANALGVPVSGPNGAVDAWGDVYVDLYSDVKVYPAWTEFEPK